MTKFDIVWRRIVALEGEPFTTKKGLPFTYRIEREALYPSRTEYRLSRADFAKAYSRVPLAGPGLINREVRGPSYIWAILHDKRVAHDE